MGTTNKKGLHLLRIEINSSKIDELKSIVNKNKSAIIWIIESKLDHAVPDLKVDLPGYDILWYDWNEMVIVLLVI